MIRAPEQTRKHDGLFETGIKPENLSSIDHVEIHAYWNCMFPPLTKYGDNWRKAISKASRKILWHQQDPNEHS